MKKALSRLLLIGLMIILCVFLTSCANKNTGTVIPKSTEMQNSLEKMGYSVELTDELMEGYSGIHLTATKENEYIEVYWLDDVEACDYFCSVLDGIYPNRDRLVEMENDDKFGNIVFCGSELAIDASGIKIIDVKVKV